ncbi:MAG: DUF1385 domain-containing protein [bacterium]
MMRGPKRIATAVRDPQGHIRVKAYTFVSASRKHRVLGLPVLRGVVGLYEAMSIGIRSLNWSADVAAEEEAPPAKKWFDPILSFLMSLVAIAVGIGLFMAIPYAVAGLIPTAQNQVHFHLVAGGLRILLLIGYMWGISLIPEISTVFRYHGAEHKSIFAFEKNVKRTPANACTQSRFHPRCGTSFLLLAAVLTMIGFMLFDSAWTVLVGSYSGVAARIAVHLPLVPVIAGFSYEFLRLVEHHSEEPAWQPFVRPGFWLQKITTREPDERQVEVALAALEEALIEDDRDYLGAPRVNGY